MIARLFRSRYVKRKAQDMAQALAWGALLGTLLLALLVYTPVRASIEPPFAPDFTVTGGQVGSNFGFAVAPAGDINDDGYGDLLVGAPLIGQITVYTGSAQGLTADAFFSATSSQSGDFFSYSVDGGGDVNGDGVDDFVAGAYSGDKDAEHPNVGLVYIYHGAAGVQPSLAMTVTGETPGDQFGLSAALAGDVNGDAYDDLIAGAWKYGEGRGRVYLYHGSAAGIQSTPALTLTGELPLDGFGYAVDGAGDINGDGFDDVLIGAWHNIEGGLDAGKVYVYYGSAAGVSPHIRFSVLGSPESELGAAVAGAGDVNGDGYADIVVGAYRDDRASTDAGAVQLFLGSPNGPVMPGIEVAAGEAPEDGLGFAVDRAGDINGDGFGDLLAGAYLNDSAAEDAGKAYAYGGCVGGLLPGQLFASTGEYAFDQAGRAVAGIGDVNGDGVDDVAVGAFAGKLVNGEILLPTGKVYVHYGVKGGGCQARIQVSVSLGLAGYAPRCGLGSTLQVPPNTVVEACYRVENTGIVPLTQHEVADGLWGTSLAGSEIMLEPGQVYTHVVTHTVTADASGVITWTAGLPIQGMGGIPAHPLAKSLLASAGARAAVTLLPPDSDLDGDGVPDAEEGSGDADGDNVPAYLDPDEQPEVADDGPSPVYLPLIPRRGPEAITQ